MVARSPSVTVLLAVKDGAATIGQALASVLGQTFRDLELVVVDDGSTDATPDRLAAVDDARLRVLRNEASAGLASALNRGLDQARGRYVARLDADDVAFPGRLAAQVAVLEARPRLALLGTATIELEASGRLGALHVPPIGVNAVRWHALFGAPVFHPTVMLDREALDRHGLRYDPTFEESEDYDLWSRLLEVAEVDNLERAYVIRRIHSAQATKTRRDLQRRFQRAVALERIAAAAPDLDPGSAELAWRLGAGERLDPAELPPAGRALVSLQQAFRANIGPGGEAAAARALLRAASRAPAGAGPELVRLALGIDPAAPARNAARRASRVRRAHRAREEAALWLHDLERESASDRPIRVTVVSPEPTPYRSPLFDRVALRPEIDLTVVYAARTVARRTWEVEPRHHAVFLDGVQVPGLRRVLRHDYPVTPGIARALGASRPDVVVVSGWSTFPSQAALAWCRRHRVPYLLLVSSHDEGPKAGWRRAVKGTVVPPVVKAAAGGLVLGTRSRESLVALGARPDRLHVFANTIDVPAWTARADELAARRPELRAALGAGPQEIVVLSVARLAPEKGLDTLVRAVFRAGPRLRLVIAGEGPQRRSLEALAHELGVELLLPGDLPHDRVPELYAAADVFVLPSWHEPWGVVVNEAAASGLPLVLSDRVGAASDLLQDRVNGALVAPGDISALADAIRRYADDPAARLAAAAASRERMEGWDYPASVDNFVTAVREATAR